MSKNYAIIIQFVLPLTKFYPSGAQRKNVYKRDAFVTLWRSHNRAWQLRRQDRLSETSGTLNPPRGFDQSAMLTSYRVWDYLRNGMADWNGTKMMWVIHSWPWYWLVWPWWGGQMYRIVTGVTSDVDVPSTYLKMYSHLASYLFVQQLKTKFTMEQHYMLPILYTVNTMPARASAAMVLTPKADYSVSSIRRVYGLIS